MKHSVIQETLEPSFRLPIVEVRKPEIGAGKHFLQIIFRVWDLVGLGDEEGEGLEFAAVVLMQETVEDGEEEGVADCEGEGEIVDGG